MDVQINFFNYSHDASRSNVVIFQKNYAASFDELSVIWKVIQQCGYGNFHPFSFPMEMQLNMSDSYGNHTPRLTASPGQLFHAILTPSGNKLVYKGPATSVLEIQVQNDLTIGAINANIFRGGRILACKKSVPPGQKAVFKFNPAIFIGVASQIVEGQAVDSAVISHINTELILLGIAQADIIMTGGGPGAKSSPFNFTLENIVMA